MGLAPPRLVGGVPPRVDLAFQAFRHGGGQGQLNLIQPSPTRLWLETKDAKFQRVKLAS